MLLPLLAAAALSTSTAASAKAPATFDLATLRGSEASGQTERQRYLPADPGDAYDADDGFRWKFKGNKVKVWVPLGPS